MKMDLIGVTESFKINSLKAHPGKFQMRELLITISVSIALQVVERLQVFAFCVVTVNDEHTKAWFKKSFK